MEEELIDREELYGKKRKFPVYYFDIDGTITNETEGWDYARRTPRLDVINKMNTLFCSGCKIILWTARLEIDRAVTVSWLRGHNVLHDQLMMSKPFWDLYICDKAINIEEWNKQC
jgi:hypothetical protein